MYSLQFTPSSIVLRKSSPVCSSLEFLNPVDLFGCYMLGNCGRESGMEFMLEKVLGMN